MSESTIPHMDFSAFEQKIGHRFKNAFLIEQAFTHRSFLNENRQSGREHNERLEFLGDAVLELVVTEFLYAKYPHKDEGELTAVRAALVNTVSISAAATKLNMNEHLLLSRAVEVQKPVEDREETRESRIESRGGRRHR